MAQIERKRIIEWEDPQKNARNVDSTSGLDYLKLIKAGKISPPPIAKLVGYKVHTVEKGYVVYELDPQEYQYNPFLTVHGGILSTILDTAMTASVLSSLKRGVSCSTAEMKVNFIRPVTVKTGRLICKGKLIHLGKRLATAEGKIKDTQDDLYAHATSTCLVF